MEKKEALEKIKTELKLKGRSEKTISSYIFFNQKFLEFLEHAEKRADNTTEQDIKNFLVGIVDRYSRKSYSLAICSLRFFYDKVLEKSIMARIELPKKEEKLPEVLSREEVIALIDSAQSSKSRLIISMLYASGMRVSELCNLKVSDLNVNEKTGWIRAGKGKKDRLFILSEKLIEDIGPYLDKHQGTYIFSKEKPLTPRNIQKIIKGAAKKAAINKKVTPHTLRHSFCTHLLESGTDIRVIQELAGHKSLDTTRIYTHVSAEELKKVKNPLDSLYKSKSEEKQQEKQEEREKQKQGEKKESGEIESGKIEEKEEREIGEKR